MVVLVVGLLLLLCVAGWVWLTVQNPAPVVSESPAEVVSQPPPPKSVLFGLWDAPDSHFWSDNLRVGPPQVTRFEFVPHGPVVAEQAGRTRPYLGSRKEASVWTELLRRFVNSTGVANLLDKSFYSSGYLDRSLSCALCTIAPPRSEEIIYDGGDQTTESTNILDGGNATTTGPPLDGNP